MKAALENNHDSSSSIGEWENPSYLQVSTRIDIDIYQEDAQNVFNQLLDAEWALWTEAQESAIESVFGPECCSSICF